MQSAVESARGFRHDRIVTGRNLRHLTAFKNLVVCGVEIVASIRRAFASVRVEQRAVGGSGL